MSNDIPELDSKVLARLNTRESSTLTFATVAASSSLVVLGLVIADGLITAYPWLIWIGVIFSLLGFLYREATLRSIDDVEYKQILSKPLRDKLNEYRKTRAQHFATEFRRWTVRFFLLLPTIAWPIFAWNIGNNSLYFATSVGSTALFSLVLSVSRSSARKFGDVFRRRTKNIRLSLVIVKWLKRTPRTLVGASKAYFKAVLFLVGLLIADHLLELTTSPYYIPFLLAVGTPIILVLVIARGAKWAQGFANRVSLGSVWLIATMANILGKIPENLVPLHPTVSADTVMSLFAVFILLLPVAWILSFGDWFKSSGKLTPDKNLQ